MLSLKAMRKMCTTFVISLALLLLLGTAATESAGETFEITEIRGTVNGNLKVTWTDPQNNGPYKILFQPVTEASKERPSNELFVWCNSGEINEKEYTEAYVVPDASWWFVIADSAGNQTVGKFEAKDSNFDRAWAMQITGQSQIARKGNGSTRFEDTGEKMLDIPMLKVDDVVSASDGVSYGIHLKMKCQNSAAYGQYLAKYVMESRQPGMAADNSPMIVGFTTDTSMPLVFSEDYKTMETFVNLSPYIKRIINAGSDPAGYYELKVYFDGCFVGSVAIRIK